MALTNYERVGKTLAFVKDGLAPFVEREMKSEYGDTWFTVLSSNLNPVQTATLGTAVNLTWDIALILRCMEEHWRGVLKKRSVRRSGASFLN